MAKKKELTNEELVGKLLTRLYNQREELEDERSEIDGRVYILDDIIPALEQISGDIDSL